MPRGVADSYRYWGPNETLFITGLSGCTVTDLNGTCYHDFRLAYGPIILGYRDPRVDAKVIEAIRDFGSLCGLSTTRESAVALRIKRLCPGIEKLRFANSGTEAVLGAVRTARGFIGRQKIVCLEAVSTGSVTN